MMCAQWWKISILILIEKSILWKYRFNDFFNLKKCINNSKKTRDEKEKNSIEMCKITWKSWEAQIINGKAKKLYK